MDSSYVTEINPSLVQTEPCEQNVGETSLNVELLHEKHHNISPIFVFETNSSSDELEDLPLKIILGQSFQTWNEARNF